MGRGWGRSILGAGSGVCCPIERVRRTAVGAGWGRSRDSRVWSPRPRHQTPDTRHQRQRQRTYLPSFPRTRESRAFRARTFEVAGCSAPPK
ncbi:hypothetical protein LG3211_0462 [Lysobacter gummosus]|nr:hypothetical protein LG3211_0462 [Lysobacter gummosus]